MALLIKALILKYLPGEVHNTLTYCFWHHYSWKKIETKYSKCVTIPNYKGKAGLDFSDSNQFFLKLWYISILVDLTARVFLISRWLFR